MEKWVAYDRANGLYKSCKHRLDNWNHNLAKSIVSNFLSSVKSKPVAAWITFCALFSTRSVTRQLKLYHFYDIYTLHMRVSMCVCLRFLLLNSKFYPILGANNLFEKLWHENRNPINGHLVIKSVVCIWRSCCIFDPYSSVQIFTKHLCFRWYYAEGWWSETISRSI